MNDELFTQRDIDVDLADDWRRCSIISFRDRKEMIVVIATVERNNR